MDENKDGEGGLLLFSKLTFSQCAHSVSPQLTPVPSSAWLKWHLATSYKNKVVKLSHVCILGSNIHREFSILVLILQRCFKLQGSQVVHSAEGTEEEDDFK